jgi:hypothetical protein
VKDLYNEICLRLKNKKTLEDKKDLPCSWIDIFIFCENDYITKCDPQIQSYSYQNFNDILHRNRKINPKIYMEVQKTLNNQSNPQPKKNNAGSITLLGFKLYHRTKVTKPSWYWNKNRHVDQWERIKGPKINPCP